MNHPRFKIDTINMISLYDCQPHEIIQFYMKNKTHLKASMPFRDSYFYEVPYWTQQISDYRQAFEMRKSIKFVLKNKNIVIGIINFDQIIYGAFQACYLGYALDQEYQGKGIMTKALQCGLNYIIKELHLNRIMANYTFDNQRSGKLLRRLGFEMEGYARNYLMLNGKWKDHILMSFINDELG